jgi:hypothetical protein
MASSILIDRANDPITRVSADIIGKGLTVRKAAYREMHFQALFTPDGYNPKTKKGRAAGYSTAIMHFAPASLSGFEVCRRRSAGCTACCLNTAGHGGINLDSAGLNAVQRARIWRTLVFFLNRCLFNEVFVREIAQHVRRARHNGLIPAVRPNGTSDLDFERIKLTDGRTVLETFPDVQFYDYTKIVERALANARGEHPANYFLCFSRSETNWNECQQVLNAGGNVAVVFNICHCKRACKHEMPEGMTYQGYRVINGDHDDLRFKDERGVIVGLKAKGRAKEDTSGFVVDVRPAKVTTLRVRVARAA